MKGSMVTFHEHWVSLNFKNNVKKFFICSGGNKPTITHFDKLMLICNESRS